MNIGRFKLTPLELGNFRLDGGAMFGVVPRVLWEKKHPPDNKNRIEMALRCLLIEFDDKKILVDTGFGQDRSEKFRKIFHYTGSDNYLDDSLAGIDVSTGDITDVILTHLHFDHCGGATINKGIDPVPAFPNARYHIQERQLDHARSRLERDRASYLFEDFEPLIERNATELHDGPWEIIEGIEMIECNGHTPAMQLVKVQDVGNTLFYAADLIPLSSQLSLSWIMSYDLYPVKTLEEKQSILKQAAEESWIICYEHDPVLAMGKVRVGEKGYESTDLV